jgi:cytochrome P450
MTQAFATCLIVRELLLTLARVDLYDSPEEFKPERFLTNPMGLKLGVDTEGHRPNMTFGFGRVRSDI